MTGVNKATISQKVAKGSSPREQSCQARQHLIVRAKTTRVNSGLAVFLGLGHDEHGRVLPAKLERDDFLAHEPLCDRQLLGQDLVC